MPSPSSSNIVSGNENISSTQKSTAANESSDEMDIFLLSNLTNRNNSNNFRASQNNKFFKSHNIDSPEDMYDENVHITSHKKIPTPYTWSPSISKAYNPSISITPEKPSGKNSYNFNSQHMLESPLLNRIPEPAQWSPGMIVQPDPMMFVTPDKLSTIGSQNDFLKCNYENSPENLKKTDRKENVNTQMVKNKEKQCVRFDLPSASSGDETLDESLFSESPITLKGSDVNNSSSPVWKPLNLQKSYNPNDYSDESMIDDSFLDTSKSYFGNTLEFSNPVMGPSDAKSDVRIALLSSIKQLSSDSSLKTNALKESIRDNDKTTVKLSSNKSNPELSKAIVVCSKPKELAKKKKSVLPNEKSQFLRSLSEPVITSNLSVIREEKSNHTSADYSYPFSLGESGQDSECEHIFARPEYNSTLKIRAEFDSISQQDVNALKVLETTLAKSEDKRTEINEKAASYTNCRSDQFKDLVDIDPSVETLCQRVVRMRTSKTLSKRKLPKVERKTSDNAPDLMEFFTSDLLKETPDLNLPGVVSVTPELATANHDLTFDLYRHNRMWFGINDF